MAALWAVRYTDDADPQFGCSGVYDPAADQLVTRNCETSRPASSLPDGEHLLGMRGRQRRCTAGRLDRTSSGDLRPGGGRVVKALLDGRATRGSRLGPAQWSAAVPIDGGEPEVVEPVAARPGALGFLLSE